jgi:hypothetical protein
MSAAEGSIQGEHFYTYWDDARSAQGFAAALKSPEIFEAIFEGTGVTEVRTKVDHFDGEGTHVSVLVPGLDRFAEGEALARYEQVEARIAALADHAGGTADGSDTLLPISWEAGS